MLGRLASRTVSEFLDDGCPQRAAAISYYTLLSLFPLAIIAVAGFGVIVDDASARRGVIDFVLERIPLRPDRGERDLEELLRTVTGQAGGLGVIGFAGLLVAASAVMGSVRHALNAAWDVEQRRPFAQGKALDMALVLVAALLIGVSLAITVVIQLAPWPGFVPLGSLTSGLLTFGVLLLVFRVVPARPTAVRDLWPGAVLGAVGFEAAKFGFSLYLRTVADYSAVYASLGSIVAFLVFIFVAANVLLLAAEAASEWPGVRDTEPRPGPGPPWRRRVAAALKGLIVR
jgi:membrane protein